MTTYVGKDVTVLYDIDGDAAKETLGKVQEISIDIDNGKKDVLSLGSAEITEFAYTKIGVSGSLSVVADNDSTGVSVANLLGLVLPSNGLPTSSPTEDMEVNYGSDFTITLTDVSFDDASFSSSPEGDPLKIELSFTARGITVA